MSFDLKLEVSLMKELLLVSHLHLPSDFNVIGFDLDKTITEFVNLPYGARSKTGYKILDI